MNDRAEKLLDMLADLACAAAKDGEWKTAIEAAEVVLRYSPCAHTWCGRDRGVRD